MSASGSNAPIGVAHAADDTATIGTPRDRKSRKLFVEPIRRPCGGGRRARPRWIWSVPRPRMPAERVTRVVGVGVGDQHRRGPAAGEPGGPGVAERDVAGGEQTGEIGQRAAGRDQPGESARLETELLADRVDRRHARRPWPMGPSRKSPSPGS